MGLLALRGLHGGIGWWSDVCHISLLHDAIVDQESQETLLMLAGTRAAAGAEREPRAAPREAPSGDCERLLAVRLGTLRQNVRLTRAQSPGGGAARSSVITRCWAGLA